MSEVQLIKPSPEEANWCSSPSREVCCIGCRWALFKDSTTNWFHWCRRLSIWTWEYFCCKYFKPRRRKMPKKGFCEYIITGKQYNHPKNCETCLLNPETCRKSSLYNPNWDPKRGGWKTSLKAEEGG